MSFDKLGTFKKNNMAEIEKINLPYEELENYVVENIKISGTSFEFKNFCANLAKLLVDKGVVINPHTPAFQGINFCLKTTDENKVREILWDFIIQRVLTLGDYHNAGWPHLSLTEYGSKAINSVGPIPNDSSGYIKALKDAVPDLDPIIETYILESIRTYNINQLLSSTITLGCASERAILLIIDIYADNFKDADRAETFRKKIAGKFIKVQFDEFQKSVKPLLSNFPYEIKENFDNTFTGVYQMIRNNRNDAGHPTGKKIDKDSLFANIRVFIPYCKYIYDLKKYLEDHKHD